MKLFIVYSSMFDTGYEVGQLKIFELNFSNYFDYLYHILNSKTHVKNLIVYLTAPSQHAHNKNNGSTTIFDYNDLYN